MQVYLSHLNVFHLLPEDGTKGNIKPAFFTAAVDCSPLPSGMGLYSPLPPCASHVFFLFSSLLLALSFAVLFFFWTVYFHA